jgi:phosphoglycolate phosphatase-like HAD superfamily hydrolase
MPKLALFDIDGTLIDSGAVDAECFVRSLEDAFGIRNVDTRWERYRHATDAAIFEEIFEERAGRKPLEEERESQIDCFLERLREYRRFNPDLFREIRGASAMLDLLKRHAEWRVAIATGTWKEAASFKLDAAGLDVRGIPISTCSDAHSREAIIRGCIATAKDFYQAKEFRRIVSIGDALWDMRTAAKLQIPFIKIGTAEYPEISDSAFALVDFHESERFLRYLDEAVVPSP